MRRGQHFKGGQLYKTSVQGIHSRTLTPGLDNYNDYSNIIMVGKPDLNLRLKSIMPT